MANLRLPTQQELTQEQIILESHEYLKEFINKFGNAKRGGMHDIIEMALFNMLNSCIGNIDKYLQSSSINSSKIDMQQIVTIMADSFQKVLDSIKKNLDAATASDFK